MTTTLRTCLLAATFGLAVLLAVQSGAQEADSRKQPNPDSASRSDQTNRQKSQAYQEGYQQGLKDRSDNLEPNTRYSSNGADRPAYESGYRAGYCRDEGSKTGYYNGIYRGYGPPVVRNGYYGYNAPDPYCENNRGKAPLPRGDPEAPQNRVEYGGGG